MRMLSSKMVPFAVTITFTGKNESKLQRVDADFFSSFFFFFFIFLATMLGIKPTNHERGS